MNVGKFYDLVEQNSEPGDILTFFSNDGAAGNCDLSSTRTFPERDYTISVKVRRKKVTVSFSYDNNGKPLERDWFLAQLKNLVEQAPDAAIQLKVPDTSRREYGILMGDTLWGDAKAVKRGLFACSGSKIDKLAIAQMYAEGLV